MITMDPLEIKQLDSTTKGSLMLWLWLTDHKQHKYSKTGSGTKKKIPEATIRSYNTTPPKNLWHLQQFKIELHITAGVHKFSKNFGAISKF